MKGAHPIEPGTLVQCKVSEEDLARLAKWNIQLRAKGVYSVQDSWVEGTQCTVPKCGCTVALTLREVLMPVEVPYKGRTYTFTAFCLCGFDILCSPPDGLEESHVDLPSPSFSTA